MTTHLRMTDCNCARLTWSLDGKLLSSQSSGFSFLYLITSFRRQISSCSLNSSPLICSFIIKSGPINHSKTLSLGKFVLVSSTSSAIKESLYNQCTTKKDLSRHQLCSHLEVAIRDVKEPSPSSAHLTWARNRALLVSKTISKALDELIIGLNQFRILLLKLLLGSWTFFQAIKFGHLLFVNYNIILYIYNYVWYIFNTFFLYKLIYAI